MINTTWSIENKSMIPLGLRLMPKDLCIFLESMTPTKFPHHYFIRKHQKGIECQSAEFDAELYGLISYRSQADDRNK